jgi:hypothetical protein
LPPGHHDEIHRNQRWLAPQVALERVGVGHTVYRAAVIRSPPATTTNSARRFRLQHDSSC